MHRAIERLLADGSLRARVAADGERIRAADGKVVAADLIEGLGLRRRAGEL
jgi:UDP:flavonoid glycosyltransferase YjiC (YdhE family)